MNRQKNFYYQRDKASLFLESKLYELYLKKNFVDLDLVIVNFLVKKLPSFFKIPNKYKVYEKAVNIEYKNFKKNYIPSLKKINDENLIARAKIDSELLVNMPSNMLFAYHNFLLQETKKNKKQNDTKEPTDEQEQEELTRAILMLSFFPVTPVAKSLKGYLASDTWRSVFSLKSRAAHMAASGQKRGEDGVFLVGGDRFRYPGDWSYAKVGNVINCKCYLTR